SLDSDFLYTHPAHLLYARQFAASRRISAQNQEMNRLYVAESSPTITGSMADHRLALSSARIADLAGHLSQDIASLGAPASRRLFSEAETRWLSSVVRDLKA